MEASLQSQSKPLFEFGQLSYRDVLIAGTLLGHISVMNRYALELGYPYFVWNGRVYSTGDNNGAKDTGLTEANVI